MSNRAPEIDQAWANAKTCHSNSRNVTAPARTASTAVQIRTARFKEFMLEFSKKSPDQDVRKLDLNPTTTWQEVQAQADEAIAEYNKVCGKGSWYRRPFRTTGRAVSEKTPALEAWARLLPQGDYASLACGALKLVFGAAARVKAIRELVLRSMSGFDKLMVKSSKYLELYRNDDELVHDAEELYVAILEAVEGMMKWLDKKAYKKVCDALFKQDLSEKALEEMITVNVEQKSNKLQEQIEFCFQSRLASCDETLQTLCKLLEGSEKREAFYEDLLRSQREQPLHKTEYVILPPPDPPPSYPMESIIGVAELASLLVVNPASHQQDMEWASDTDLQRTPSRQKRAVFLAKDPQFQHWIGSKASDMILVNAMESAWPPEVPSSTSYFISLLTPALLSRNAAFPLSFFCALHATPGDVLEGPRGLLRSLTYQLLAQASVQDSDLTFISLPLLDGVRVHDLSSLSDLFQRLLAVVGQLNWQPIFCLIDGISWFEDGRRRADLGTVLSSLRGFVEHLKARQEETGILLKVLVTSPTAVEFETQRWLEGVRILDLPSDLASEDFLEADDVGALI